MEEIKKTIQEVGETVSELRKGVKGYKIQKECGVAPNVLESIEKGNKKYTLLSLLTILNYFGKTIKIVDK